MKFRRATASDEQGLAKVRVDSWQVAYKGLITDEFLQKITCQKREEAFRAALEERKYEIYLAEVDDEAAGFVTIGACRDPDRDAHNCGEIWAIYISPAYWRRGIGKGLFQEAERFLLSRGFRKIVLWLLEGNTAACSFYEAMGFSPDGAVKIIDLGTPLKEMRYARDYPQD